MDLFENCRGAPENATVIGPFQLDKIRTQQRCFVSEWHKNLYRRGDRLP